MIQPLRIAHGRIFLVLAAMLPTLIAVGLSARRDRIANWKVTIPSPSLAASTNSAAVVWQNDILTTQVYLQSAQANFVTLRLKPSRELSDPDLLLYWAEQDIPKSADLSHARLLGSFAEGKSFSVPRGQQAGFLVLYSLAHQVIVDKAKVEGLP